MTANTEPTLQSMSDLTAGLTSPEASTQPLNHQVEVSPSLSAAKRIIKKRQHFAKIWNDGAAQGLRVREIAEILHMSQASVSHKATTLRRIGYNLSYLTSGARRVEIPSKEAQKDAENQEMTASVHNKISETKPAMTRQTQITRQMAEDRMKFVEAWVSAVSERLDLESLAKKLGTKANTLAKRAARLRKEGVELPNISNRNTVTLEESVKALNERIKAAIAQ